ncbi:proteic killer suppression protein [Rhizobiales bacterium GAS188]|nr:proteic killer suppression protein [Rhizobiales bacterium GAS188]
MIESFRHKGLRQLFEDDSPKGVNAEHIRKIKQILALLEAAQSVADLDYVGFRLHPLKGDLKRVLVADRARELANCFSFRGRPRLGC